MKRLPLTILLFAGAVLVFAQNPVAEIREMSGTVELKRPGSAAWTAAKIGDQIDRATVITTGIRSSALLAIGNSTLLVRPVTSLSLEDLLSQDGTETINISLSAGRVRVDVTPPVGQKTNYTVRAPSVTASVRGTSFEMDTSSIRVLSGTVSYASAAAVSSRPVKVGADQESWVNTDTGVTVNPMAASATNRILPALPGEYAGTLPDDVPRALSVETGSFDVEVTF